VPAPIPQLDTEIEIAVVWILVNLLDDRGPQELEPEVLAARSGDCVRVLAGRRIPGDRVGREYRAIACGRSDRTDLAGMPYAAARAIVAEPAATARRVVAFVEGAILVPVE